MAFVCSSIPCHFQMIFTCGPIGDLIVDSITKFISISRCLALHWTVETVLESKAPSELGLVCKALTWLLPGKSLLKKIFFIHLLMVALSCCFAQAFSSCSERGLLFIVVLLTVVASLVVDHGLKAHRLISCGTLA